MERVTRRGMLFLLALFLVLTLLLSAVVLPFLAYVFFGGFAAFLVWRPHLRLRRRVGEKVSATLLMVGVYAALFVPLALVAASIARDVASFLRRLQAEGTSEVLSGFLHNVLPEEMADRAVESLTIALGQMGQGLALGLVGRFLDALLGFFIFGFVLYYCLLHGDSLVGFLRSLVPLRPHRVDGLFSQIGSCLDAVFFGVLIVAVVQGTAGGVAWWIAGLPNPFFYGVVMFVLSILPFAGPSFLLLPVSLWHFAQGEVFLGVFLAVCAVVLVGGIDNVMRPYLVGRFGRINPALVVVGLAGGLVAFGIVGIVLGPLFFALWVAVARELRDEVVAWKKEALAEADPPVGDEAAPAPDGTGAPAT